MVRWCTTKEKKYLSNLNAVSGPFWESVQKQKANLDF